MLLRGCYLFRGMPFLRVTFLDGRKLADFIGQDVRRQAIVHAKSVELYGDQTAGFINGRITEPVSILYFYYIHVVIIATSTKCAVDEKL